MSAQERQVEVMRAAVSVLSPSLVDVLGHLHRISHELHLLGYKLSAERKPSSPPCSMFLRST